MTASPVRNRARGDARRCAECGVEFRPLVESLRAGGGLFCSRACMGVARRTHGATANGKRTVEYQTWRRMKVRCFNKASKDYPEYGGRGITVCDRWRDSFEAFLSDMGQRPSPLHSIDRRENGGNYEPCNCRWATSKEQANNRRRRMAMACKQGHALTPENVMVAANGSRRCLECHRRWARERYHLLRTRQSAA